MFEAMTGPRILIIRLSAVGDVIRTLPAVKALKAHLPSSSIAWIVEEPSKAFLESQPEISEVILFPRRRWSRGIRSATGIPGTIREALKFISDLRRRRFDIVLDFHGILKSGLLSFVSGSPKRIGFDRGSTKEGNFLFSNFKVVLPKGRMSRFQRNFELLRGLGLEARRFDTRLNIPDKDRRYVESFFRSHSAGLRRPLIAIHPGTSLKTPYKRWMPGRYSQLADRLVRELGASVVFTWGPEEMDLVENIRKIMVEPSLPAPRTESLTQVGEILRRCNIYIGGDTGPMHIASLVGTPVVAIFGPTDPIVNEPLGPHRIVRKDVGCNPCRNRSCKDLNCLKAVEVEDVLKAIKEVLRLTH
jgi:lipopolysaccharide heptosyltransferase I